MADSRIPELVGDLEAQVTACLLSELSIEHQHAVAISKKVARHVTNHWGGQLIYIPKNHIGKISERDRQVYDEFNGKNHAALSRKYNLMVQQIYRIVKLVGEQDMAERQGCLLDD